jgi:hypothetical protein
VAFVLVSDLYDTELKRLPSMFRIGGRTVNAKKRLNEKFQKMLTTGSCGKIGPKTSIIWDRTKCLTGKLAFNMFRT